MPGYVRVVNKRFGIGPKPDDDETVLSVDRTNRILGNPHILKDVNDPVARQRVIDRYRSDLSSDIRRDGPMSAEIRKISERVLSGEKICLACWCAPRPCHADIIADEVRNIVARTSLKKPSMEG